MTVPLKISQYLQENTSVGVFLNIVAGLQVFFKKRFQGRWFPVNITKFLRTVFFYRTLLVAASKTYCLKQL